MHKKANLNSTQDIEYWGTGVIKTKEAQFCAFSKWIKENVLEFRNVSRLKYILWVEGESWQKS